MEVPGAVSLSPLCRNSLKMADASQVAIRLPLSPRSTTQIIVIVLGSSEFIHLSRLGSRNMCRLIICPFFPKELIHLRIQVLDVLSNADARGRAPAIDVPPVCLLLLHFASLLLKLGDELHFLQILCRWLKLTLPRTHIGTRRQSEENSVAVVFPFPATWRRVPACNPRGIFHRVQSHKIAEPLDDACAIALIVCSTFSEVDGPTVIQPSPLPGISSRVYQHFADGQMSPESCEVQRLRSIEAARKRIGAKG
mmetsp:Transcript_62234/g.166994  ORF Transcript_62234/g.166994 Transcript_62234/m.166994 type:complete len:252 (-) Transcript_62234:183-938(-)